MAFRTPVMSAVPAHVQIFGTVSETTSPTRLQTPEPTGPASVLSINAKSGPQTKNNLADVSPPVSARRFRKRFSHECVTLTPTRHGVCKAEASRQSLQLLQKEVLFYLLLVIGNTDVGDRKRKCDGRQPVCTLCEEANNSECEYRDEGNESK